VCSFRVEFLRQNSDEPSTIANYYSPIISLLQWIVRSTSGVVACGGLILSSDQERTLVKTIDAWKEIRQPNYHQAKRKAVLRNTREKMQANNHWTSTTAIRNAMRDTIIPQLRVLTDQKSLSPSDKHQYFELLMFTLMVTRPCRPSTYYAAYVHRWRRRHARSLT
jgi:hypothetical protein